jgi:hypothetical protein
MATPRKFDWTNGHVQRETGTDSPHIQRELVLFAPRIGGSGLTEWRVAYLIPRAIYDAVDSGKREEVRLHVQDLFQKMLGLALLMAEPNAAQICLEEALRTYLNHIYTRFWNVQVKTGNKKWLVPATIQERVFEEN